MPDSFLLTLFIQNVILDFDLMDGNVLNQKSEFKWSLLCDIIGKQVKILCGLAAVYEEFSSANVNFGHYH
ncbi:MAG: hypothetical protein K0R21_1268 [Anaerocolumna sp.]|jgi:hypothetical protein|nr:hypothetical protein [Anaerocolumna sp.]